MDGENTTAVAFIRERLEAISGRCSHTLEVLNNFFNNDFSMCTVARKRGTCEDRKWELEGRNVAITRGGGIHVSQSSLSTAVRADGATDGRTEAATA